MKNKKIAHDPAAPMFSSMLNIKCLQTDLFDAMMFADVMKGKQVGAGVISAIDSVSLSKALVNAVHVDVTITDAPKKYSHSKKIEVVLREANVHMPKLNTAGVAPTHPKDAPKRQIAEDMKYKI